MQRRSGRGKAQGRRTRRETAQLGFVWRKHGGARVGAGRPVGQGRRNVRHRVRPRVVGRHPQHVTLRLRKEVGWLRSERALRAVYRSLARGCERFATRVVHFSVQGDHVHLVVEAADRVALARAMKGLSVRIARALNKVIGRRGAAFADRYHARELASPREVRHGLAYVLCNYRHHAAQRGRRVSRWWIDPCSSGWYFAGWRGRGGGAVSGGWAPVRSAPQLAEAKTWLLTVGWRRAGLIEVDHVPGAKLDSGGHAGGQGKQGKEVGMQGWRGRTG